MFLLSDFGTADEFAGVVHGVVVREAPGCPVVVLTHDVPAFDVRAGALALERAVPHLGPGVVLAVVDPGVGTARRAIAVSVAPKAGPTFLVGPDNGLLGFALQALGGATGAVALPCSAVGPETGATFDGRDVFAPVAARLWCGTRLADVGSPIDTGSLAHLPSPRLEVGEGLVLAEVLWVDRYGNVQLAARAADAVAAGLGSEPKVVARGVEVVARRTTSFADLGEITDPKPGKEAGVSSEDVVGLVTDSNGRLALVCRQRSAAALLGIGAGDVVAIYGRSHGVGGPAV